ncbi:MAG: Crp/Fnr family transcriptional regulator [Clostridia bacterium]|nr:Crp/Fnr family transcriptional regulator [Clostridia bacterium]
MKNFISILKKTQLFSGVEEKEIESMLACLNTSVQEYKKGEYLIQSGEYINNVMILVKGRLHIQNDDYLGNRIIINQISVGEMFGESYISNNYVAITHDVLAVEDSTVMFFDVDRIMTSCSSACSFHLLVIKNLFNAISEKNRRLVGKINHISKRTIREKLISYLSEQSKINNSMYFSIPFNRQQLADFLSVDRSALSNELCKMRNEGLLEFEKNQFKLLIKRG